MPASIHRFGDMVALYTRAVDDSGRYSERGVTFYLSPDEARELSDALHQYAVSCDNVPFTESKLGTVDYDWTGSRFAAHRSDKKGD